MMESNNIAKANDSSTHSDDTDSTVAAQGHVEQGAFGNIDFNPRFSNFKSADRKATSLEFRDISLTIGDKQILHEITGEVKSGQVCALIGPSGAGKSSLLNTLAGRVVQSKTRKISGQMLVNGSEVNPLKFRQNIAYVMQEDLLYATATARESLEFSAKLRLPPDVADNQKSVDDIVDRLLDALGLSHVANTLVGSERQRGVSGGEKKRIAIGVELVTNPSLLFLDEPTSGLDSFSAWKVVKILKSLAKSTGSVVLCTIHQPSSEIFNAFDSVLMLSKGRNMYHGPVKNIPAAFGAQGHPMPEFTNPADFVMVLAQTITNAEEMPHYNEKVGDRVENGQMIRGGSKSFSRSKSLQGNEASHFVADTKAGQWKQTKVLLMREFRSLSRSRQIFVSVGVRTIMNAIFGLVFFQVATRDENYDVRSAFGGLTMIIMSSFMSAVAPPLTTFPLERGIMIREYQTGTYSGLSYLTSKLLVEIPELFVVNTIVILVVFYLIGLEGNFMAMVATATMLGVTGSSYAVLIGAAVSDAKQAQEFQPLLTVPQIIFTGLFVPVTQIPIFLRWIQYITVMKYGLNVAMIIEWGGCSKDENDPFQAQCLDILESNDVDENSMWVYIGVMLAVFFLFRLLSLAMLVSRAKYFAG